MHKQSNIIVLTHAVRRFRLLRCNRKRLRQCESGAVHASDYHVSTPAHLNETQRLFVSKAGSEPPLLPYLTLPCLKAKLPWLTTLNHLKSALTQGTSISLPCLGTVNASLTMAALCQVLEPVCCVRFERVFCFGLCLFVFGCSLSCC